MFVSFFPRPKLFFLSAIVWTALAMAFWYGFAGNLIGSTAPGGVGVEIFWSAPSLWFDLYFAFCVAIFAGAWMVFAPHPWALWSILGSALILFTSYFQVQVSVAINSWINGVSVDEYVFPYCEQGLQQHLTPLLAAVKPR